ncbi:MAG: outer membrane lipid asymmetry maintenance protein MlaD [Holosporales bacterium]|jgi:phospholipid/cholesterol/gamma-HCH transport system substrate-binding protein|nr:outer membrane lipid asymmetry maintenance protein MlaD [Holosporales bacterium]
MKGNVLEAVIGAIVLIVASFFMYFAYISSGEKIREGYVLLAKFDDVSGLSTGADIKLNGIKIGIVKSLKIDESYQAQAELLIKDEIKIPKDSSASIVTEGIIGNKFVAMMPGFDEEKLKNGEEISLTQSAVNLEKLIVRFVASGNNGQEKDK